MKSQSIKIQLERPEELRKLIFSNTNFDFVCCVEDTTFNLHKEALRISEFFNQKIENGDSICVMRDSPSINCFSKVLQILYGCEQQICRRGQICDVMQIIIILKIKPLQMLLINDLMDNSDEYPVFTLFKISQQHGLNQLRTKCLEKLKKENYEQINYQRYQFFQLPHHIFQQILVAHQQNKIEGVINGFSDREIKEIAMQYDDHNHTTTDVTKLIKTTIIEMDLIPELQDNDNLFKSQVFLRKKMNLQEEEFQNIAGKQQIDCQDCLINDEPLNIEEISFEVKKCILSQLKEMNIKILEENMKMIDSINQFSESMDKKRDSNSTDHDQQENMEQKLRKIQQISDQQSCKLSELQKNVSQYLRKSSFSSSRGSDKIENKLETAQKSCQSTQSGYEVKNDCSSNIPIMEGWSTNLC